MMSESRGTVQSGLSETARAGASLEAIIGSSNEVENQIHLIATAAAEQTAASGEISESASHISNLAAQNSQAAEETADGMQEPLRAGHRPGRDHSPVSHGQRSSTGRQAARRVARRSAGCSTAPRLLKPTKKERGLFRRATQRLASNPFPRNTRGARQELFAGWPNCPRGKSCKSCE